MPARRTRGSGPYTVQSIGTPIGKPRSPRMRKCGECGAFAGESCQMLRRRKATRNMDAMEWWVKMRTFHEGR